MQCIKFKQYEEISKQITNALMYLNKWIASDKKALTRNVGYGDRASVGCLLSSGACNVNSNGNVNWNNVNNDNNGVVPDLFLIFVCLQE